MTPGYAPVQQSYQRWEREESTKRGAKRKDGEGGGLRKLRLRSGILAHSLFTASHVEVLEKGEKQEEGHTRKKDEKKKGSSKTTMAISKTSQLEIVSDHSAPLPWSTTARSTQSHRQSPDE